MSEKSLYKTSPMGAKTPPTKTVKPAEKPTTTSTKAAPSKPLKPGEKAVPKAVPNKGEKPLASPKAPQPKVEKAGEKASPAPTAKTPLVKSAKPGEKPTMAKKTLNPQAKPKPSRDSSVDKAAAPSESSKAPNESQSQAVKASQVPEAKDAKDMAKSSEPRKSEANDAAQTPVKTPKPAVAAAKGMPKGTPTKAAKVAKAAVKDGEKRAVAAKPTSETENQKPTEKVEKEKANESTKIEEEAKKKEVKKVEEATKEEGEKKQVPVKKDDGEKKQMPVKKDKEEKKKEEVQKKDKEAPKQADVEKKDKEEPEEVKKNKAEEEEQEKKEVEPKNKAAEKKEEVEKQKEKVDKDKDVKNKEEVEKPEEKQKEPKQAVESVVAEAGNQEEEKKDEQKEKVEGTSPDETPAAARSKAEPKSQLGKSSKKHVEKPHSNANTIEEKLFMKKKEKDGKPSANAKETSIKAASKVESATKAETAAESKNASPADATPSASQAPKPSTPLRKSSASSSSGASSKDEPIRKKVAKQGSKSAAKAQVVEAKETAPTTPIAETKPTATAVDTKSEEADQKDPTAAAKATKTDATKKAGKLFKEPLDVEATKPKDQELSLLNEEIFSSVVVTPAVVEPVQVAKRVRRSPARYDTDDETLRTPRLEAIRKSGRFRNTDTDTSDSESELRLALVNRGNTRKKRKTAESPAPAKPSANADQKEGETPKETPTNEATEQTEVAKETKVEMGVEKSEKEANVGEAVSKADTLATTTKTLKVAVVKIQKTTKDSPKVKKPDGTKAVAVKTPQAAAATAEKAKNDEPEGTSVGTKASAVEKPTTAVGTGQKAKKNETSEEEPPKKQPRIEVQSEQKRTEAEAKTATDAGAESATTSTTETADEGGLADESIVVPTPEKEPQESEKPQAAKSRQRGRKKLLKNMAAAPAEEEVPPAKKARQETSVVPAETPAVAPEVKLNKTAPHPLESPSKPTAKEAKTTAKPTKELVFAETEAMALPMDSALAIVETPVITFAEWMAENQQPMPFNESAAIEKEQPETSEPESQLTAAVSEKDAEEPAAPTTSTAAEAKTGKKPSPKTTGKAKGRGRPPKVVATPKESLPVPTTTEIAAPQTEAPQPLPPAIPPAVVKEDSPPEEPSTSEAFNVLVSQNDPPIPELSVESSTEVLPKKPPPRQKAATRSVQGRKRRSTKKTPAKEKNLHTVKKDPHPFKLRKCYVHLNRNAIANYFNNLKTASQGSTKQKERKTDKTKTLRNVAVLLQKPKDGISFSAETVAHVATTKPTESPATSKATTIATTPAATTTITTTTTTASKTSELAQKVSSSIEQMLTTIQSVTKTNKRSKTGRYKKSRSASKTANPIEALSHTMPAAFSTDEAESQPEDALEPSQTAAEALSKSMTSLRSNAISSHGILMIPPHNRRAPATKAVKATATKPSQMKTSPGTKTTKANDPSVEAAFGADVAQEPTEQMQHERTSEIQEPIQPQQQQQETIQPPQQEPIQQQQEPLLPQQQPQSLPFTPTMPEEATVEASVEKPAAVETQSTGQQTLATTKTNTTDMGHEATTEEAATATTIPTVTPGTQILPRVQTPVATEQPPVLGAAVVEPPADEATPTAAAGAETPAEVLTNTSGVETAGTATNEATTEAAVAPIEPPFIPIEPKEEVDEDSSIAALVANSAADASQQALMTLNAYNNDSGHDIGAMGSSYPGAEAPGEPTFGITPTTIDGNGTRLYTYLHPAKYNRSCGGVLLDFCCPNLDGPMPAIDPTRIHAQIQAAVRELPAFIVMTTKLITRADLETNKNSIPASIRQKVEKITAGAAALNGNANKVPTSPPSGASGSGVPPSQPQPCALSVLQKKLPASTSITTKTLPMDESIPPGPSPLNAALSSNSYNDYQRLMLRTNLRRFDAVMKKNCSRLSALSFIDRQRIIDGIVANGSLLSKDVDAAVTVLEEYANAMTNFATSAPTVAITASVAAPGFTSATQKLDELHATAVEKLRNKSRPAQGKGKQPPPQTQQQQPQQKRSVPIYDMEKNIIGYQLQVQASTTRGSAATASSAESSTKRVQNTTGGNSSSASVGSNTSLKQQMDSPHGFYSKSQPSTPIGGGGKPSTVATSTPIGAASAAVTGGLRSNQRLGRNVMLKGLESAKRSAAEMEASPSTSAGDVGFPRLPHLTRNPHLADGSTPPTKVLSKRMTRKAAAAAKGGVQPKHRNGSTNSGECILPDGSNVGMSEIKSENMDEDFIGAS